MLRHAVWPYACTTLLWRCDPLCLSWEERQEGENGGGTLAQRPAKPVLLALLRIPRLLGDLLLTADGRSPLMHANVQRLSDDGGAHPPPREEETPFVIFRVSELHRQVDDGLAPRPVRQLRQTGGPEHRQLAEALGAYSLACPCYCSPSPPEAKLSFHPWVFLFIVALVAWPLADTAAPVRPPMLLGVFRSKPYHPPGRFTR